MRNTEENSVWYRGKRAKTGNSLGFRFDKALFQSHPEFSGEVRAHVIGPGRMLVVAETGGRRTRTQDPMMAAFLSFLTKDAARSPQQIKPFDRRLAKRIDNLLKHVHVRPDEDLGEESLL